MCALSCGLNVAILARFFRYLDGSIFVVWMDGVSISVSFHFLAAYAFVFNGIPFYIARHLAAKFGTCLWLSLCMFLCYVYMIHNLN